MNTENIIIERPSYLEQLKKAAWNGYPKIITGIRRCGKSFLLNTLYRRWLLSNGVPNENILSLDLDDIANSSLRDPLNLYDYVLKTTEEKGRCYVFLDEIQRVFDIVNPSLTQGRHVLARKDDKEIVGFTDAVMGLSKLSNIDLYVTGSNSKLLSKDILTQFRGKATRVPVFPLSFEEIQNVDGFSLEESFKNYLQYGGMPQVALLDRDQKRTTLSDLFETTYFRDIEERHRLRKKDSMKTLCHILASEIGFLVNPEKIANTFRSTTREKTSRDSILRSISYLEESYLIQEARRYDLKGRKEIGGNRKYYFIDPGLRNACMGFLFQDQGAVFENVVYNELCRHGFEVFVGSLDYYEKNTTSKTARKSGEVDFLARKSGKTIYLQVADNLDERRTYEREIKPFLHLKDGIMKRIIVNRTMEETETEDGFRILGFQDFFGKFLKSI